MTDTAVSPRTRKPRTFAECSLCRRRFYGSRRNAKLGTHRFNKHGVRSHRQGKQHSAKASPRDMRGTVLAALSLEREAIDRAIQALESLEG